MYLNFFINKFASNEIAKFRLKAIQFFDQFGVKATREAFNVGRSTIFLWKKKLKEVNGSLLSLPPSSTRPKNPRRMVVEAKTLAFIKNLKENNGRIGKEKIKVLLDVYCQKEELPIISSSKIGRIIKRNNWFSFKQGGFIIILPLAGLKERESLKPESPLPIRVKTQENFCLCLQEFIIKSSSRFLSETKISCSFQNQGYQD